MTDDQIRLDLPALAAGRPGSHVAEEAALVFGCLLDEIGAAGEAMLALISRTTAAPARTTWDASATTRQ